MIVYFGPKSKKTFYSRARLSGVKSEYNVKRYRQWRRQDFRKGGAENLRIMKTKEKFLHLESVRFSAQN